jgi:hypothetical protein
MECRYVLPQHYLFQIAEQPPNDLPTLLNVFRVVPPVIKRRANDLLDEIRSGGLRSAGLKKTVTELGRTEDHKLVKEVQGNIQSYSGIISANVY